MTGYTILTTEDFPNLFQNTSGIEEAKVTEDSSLVVPYIYKKHKSIVVLHSAIFVAYLDNVLDDLKTRIDPQDHILIGLIGTGTTENHIVCLHIPPNGAEAQIYDSKYSNRTQFFQPEATWIGRLKGMFHALNPFASATESIPLDHLKSRHLSSVQYNSLGTQSLFDGASCGYHTASNLKTLTRLILDGKSPTTEMLLEHSKNPVIKSAEVLERDSSFAGFMKKAWQDTFLPNVPEKERVNHRFHHYFLGWPKEQGSKFAYFATLKFITTPLFNVLALFTELPLKVLSEMAGYPKNKLMGMAPTNRATQILRSLMLAPINALHFGFKGLYFLMRTITSPIISYQEAKKLSPILGIISALMSVLLIGGIAAALTLFAPPIMAALAPSMGPGALSLVSTLATPFVSLFALVGVNLSLAAGAMLSVISASAFIGLIHRVGRGVIYPQNQSEPPTPKSPDSAIPASNAAQAMAAHTNTTNAPTADEDDDFDIIETPASYKPLFSSNTDNTRKSDFNTSIEKDNIGTNPTTH